MIPPAFQVNNGPMGPQGSVRRGCLGVLCLRALTLKEVVCAGYTRWSEFSTHLKAKLLHGSRRRAFHEKQL